MKPPFPYYGGKQQLAGQIVALLPEHFHYVEPYAGSLAVLLTKPPSRMETVNDIDRELVTFWRVLRERTTELERTCALTPHSRAEYIACRDARPTEDELEMARRVWVRLTQGRGATLGDTRAGWRYSATPAHQASVAQTVANYVGRFGALADRLRGVSLECRPATELIAEYGAFRDVLIYADPPYLGSSRNTQAGYRHEMKAEADHRALAEALQACKAAVVLSSYPSALYDELYPDWHRRTLAGQTTQGNGDRTRTEVLWSNRPLSRQSTLFDLAGGAA